ncbi:MAG: hypothetical protein WBG15_21075 [Xanthobacteraceae bacterium]
MVRAIAASLLLVTTAVGASAQTLPLPSRWTSQNYSYLEFDQMVDRAEFTGIYVDHEPNFACSNVLTKLTGTVRGAKVTFTVQWWLNGPAQCGKTTWTGKISGATLIAHWVRTAKGSPPVSGTDTFTRKP